MYFSILSLFVKQLLHAHRKSLQIVVSFIVFNWFISCYSREIVAFLLHFFCFSIQPACFDAFIYSVNHSFPIFSLFSFALSLYLILLPLAFFSSGIFHTQTFLCEGKLLIVALLEVSTFFFVVMYVFLFSILLFTSIRFSFLFFISMNETCYKRNSPSTLYACMTLCPRWTSYKIDDNWKSSK